VFTVKNSSGMFTVLTKSTNFLWQMWLLLYPVLQKFYSVSHSLVVQTNHPLLFPTSPQTEVLTLAAIIIIMC